MSVVRAAIRRRRRVQRERARSRRWCRHRAVREDRAGLHGHQRRRSLRRRHYLHRERAVGRRTPSPSAGALASAARRAEMPIMNALLRAGEGRGTAVVLRFGRHRPDGCRDGTGNKILSAGWPGRARTLSASAGPAGQWRLAARRETAWTGAAVVRASRSTSLPTRSALQPADSSRDEPDVAASRPPAVRCHRLDQRRQSAVRGTSAATPIWAGLWAVVFSRRLPPARASRPRSRPLYTIGEAARPRRPPTYVAARRSGPTGAANGGYSAVAGYDLATRLGRSEPHRSDRELAVRKAQLMKRYS